MPRARREANQVRRAIIEGIKEYAEWRERMAAEAAKRRSDENRRLAEASCGTICRDIPAEFLPYMPGRHASLPAAEQRPSLSLN